MIQRLHGSVLTIMVLLFVETLFWGCLLAASHEHSVTFEEIEIYDADVEVMGKDSSVQRFSVQGTIRSKVWIRGNRLRAEKVKRSKNAKREDKWIDILIPDGIYRLHPETKTGVKTTPGVSKQEPFATDPTQMLSAFKKKGKVTKVGEARVDGQPCDIYQTGVDGGRAKSVIKLWVRRSDSVVIRLENQHESPRQLNIREYKNIRLNPVIPDSMFEVPKDYRIEDRTPKQ